MGHQAVNPGRVVATRLTEMLLGLVSGEAAAGTLPAQLRDLADWIDSKSAAPQAASKQKQPAAVREIFEYWLHATKRDPAKHKLTSERRLKVVSRLQTFTVEDIKRAIDFVASSDFHQGNNERGQRYDDLITICRNDTQLEKYRNQRDVDETPGAYRTGGSGEMAPFGDHSDLRDASREALEKGDLDAYNRAQDEIRRNRDDAGRS